jgi:hypothetical protein
VVIPPPVEPEPVVIPPKEKTESAHNEVRRVTPTGRSDFTLPGASPVFNGQSADVSAPADAAASQHESGNATSGERRRSK